MYFMASAIGSSCRFDLKSIILMKFFCISSILSIKPVCRGFQINDPNYKTERTNKKYKILDI